jgi:sugar (pentulose or hexulose) kinase
VSRNGRRHVRCESRAGNEAAAIVATATCELGLSHPAPLWSEQDPDAWVDAAIRAVEIVYTGLDLITKENVAQLMK